MKSAGLRREAHALARGLAYAGLLASPLPLLTFLNEISVPVGTTGPIVWIAYLLSGILGPISSLIAVGLVILTAYIRPWQDRLILFSLIISITSTIVYWSWWRMPLI